MIAVVKVILEPLISTAVISALAWPASRLLAAAWLAWRGCKWFVSFQVTCNREAQGALGDVKGS